MIKAIGLFSGGLDSILAIELMKEQNIDVLALNIVTPFSHKRDKDYLDKIERIVQNLGVKFKILFLKDDFFEILLSPKYGYGSNLNPCIDCKILFFNKAKELMIKTNSSFIVSGEILGQRPMSQNKQALRIIEKETGLQGLILRPLSAKLLPETIAERNEWVIRDKLLDLSGKNRKEQIDLAKKLGIEEYFWPAGGCLLTDKCFSKRVKDLIRHQTLNLNDVELLKLGRHFRLSNQAKLIVAREEEENKMLFDLIKNGDYLFKPLEIKGPLALGRGNFNNEIINISCKILAYYCHKDRKVKIGYNLLPENNQRVIETNCLDNNNLRELRI
ncbi:MAG: tRNA 4-thiouridine(8) synthase ThiI [Candidatus Omnitrophica bacterium]|nr:tRNA 4-thiouridine(8) synthase ThiI [Candidatus Omnitrophota bacterium]MCM8826768.1 tRNA 4-thiouridine(8) synthase ThiI [Candidatus Omnitrophota bacterium]